MIIISQGGMRLMPMDGNNIEGYQTGLERDGVKLWAIQATPSSTSAGASIGNYASEEETREALRRILSAYDSGAKFFRMPKFGFLEDEK